MREPSGGCFYLRDGSNYYELLGLARNATAEEIKRAYFSAVRRYPPERFPEEFKRIREAYETLSNSDHRLLYDTSLENEIFREYYEEADQAYEADEYEQAVTLLRKALEVSPGNRLARSLMGLCYLYMGEYNKAVGIFKRLTYEFPDQAVYFFNLGEALLQQGATKQAIGAFETALNLEEDDLVTWCRLARCYFQKEEYDKARNAIERGMAICGESVSAYLRLVQLDITEGNMDKLKSDIRRLEKLAENDQEMRENVAWSLVEIAERTKDDLPDFAAKLLEKAKKLDPTANEIKKLYRKATSIQKICKSFEVLEKDVMIHPWIKGIIAEKIGQIINELPVSLEYNLIQRLMLKEPANILSSVQRIKDNYPDIYKIHQKLFQTILDNPDGIDFSEDELWDDLEGIKSLVEKNEISNQTILEEMHVPPIPRVKTVDVGRNELCPCGSGKKYKKCCLGK